MSNNYNIPERVERLVRSRDKLCVYCRVRLKAYPRTKGAPRDKGTFEHIKNDASLTEETNIAMCCAACNSSKGIKTLSSWLETEYCKKKNINRKTVAHVVKQFLSSCNGDEANTKYKLLTQ